MFPAQVQVRRLNPIRLVGAAAVMMSLVSLGALAQPANDARANAEVLHPWAPSIQGAGDGATYGIDDTAEMQVSFAERGGGSLWYSWTSPVTGVVNIEGSGVFAQRLFLNRSLLIGPNSQRGTFEAVEGARYFFTVVGPSQMLGPFDFGLAFNYEFTFATPELVALVSPAPGTVHRAGEPLHLEAALKHRFDDLSAIEILATDGSVLAPWVSLPPPAFSKDTIPWLAGNYQIGVGIRLQNGALIGRTALQPLTILPPNDAFTDRSVLAGNVAESPVTTRLATREPGEPVLTGDAKARSVWWKWTAPQSGAVELAYTGYFASGKLAVYTGGSLGALARLPAGTVSLPRDGNTGRLRLQFNATGGTTYSIAYETSDFGFATETIRLVNTPDPLADVAFRIRPVIADGTASIEVIAAVGATVTLHAADAAWEFSAVGVTQAGADGIARFKVEPRSGPGARYFRASWIP